MISCLTQQQVRNLGESRSGVMRYCWRPYRPIAVAMLAAALLIPVIGWTAVRDARHDSYKSPHWELDTRHSHDHYYPARGYVVPALPPGYREIRYRNEPYFFQGGVWFRASGRGYVVVAPPPGIVLPVLPPSYSTVWIGPTAYWYANGVYYSQAPAGAGYMVAPQPQGYETGQVVPPAPPPQQAAPLPPGYALPR